MEGAKSNKKDPKPQDTPDEIEMKLQEMFDGVEEGKCNGVQKTTSTSNSTPKKESSTPKQARKGKRKLKNKNKQVEKKVTKSVPAADLSVILNKFKGPYVQIRGGKTTVINFPVNEEEPVKQQTKQKQIKKHLNHIRNGSRKIGGMHASTLSIKYDDQTTDHSWICVFCKKGPHRDKLGDLFGPYIMGEHSSNIGDNKKTLPKQKPDPDYLPEGTEIWTHESCAVNTCGIYIIANKVIGLDDAAIESRYKICTYCGLTGATLECLQRNCKSLGHFICSKQNNWNLKPNYQYFCNNHGENK